MVTLEIIFFPFFLEFAVLLLKATVTHLVSDLSTQFCTENVLCECDLEIPVPLVCA